ncbi:MAG: hypothetical protein IBJ14_11755 [Hydrogenophaga sp.]|nr:hypothetical protein [Hydrogenophaga sp.]
MNSLGRLVVQLGLDAADYTAGLSKSERQAQQWVRDIEKGVEWARTSMVTFGVAAAGAIAVVNAQAEKIAAFKDLGDQVGDTAEAVATLKAASDLSGTGLDTFASASVKLTTALAASDGEATRVGRALGAIGIEIGDFKRLSPVAQFDEVAKALAGFEDGAGKTAVAVDLFGRSGAQLLPMLNDLADGAKRQTFLTQDQIDASDEYSKQVSRLKSDLQNMATVAAADAVPQLSRMATILQDLVTYSRDASGGIKLFDGVLTASRVTLETLVVAGTDVGFVFATLLDTAGAYVAVAERLIAFDVKGAKAIGEAYREASKERRAALDDFQRRVLNPVDLSAFRYTPDEARKRGKGGKPSLGYNSSPDPKKPPKKNPLGDVFLSYDDQITQRIGNLLESTDVIQAKVFADQLAKLDQLFFSGALNADLYDSAVAKLAGTTDSAAKQVSRFVEEQKRLAELLGATESAGIAKQREDMELLAKSLGDGVISEQQYLEAVTARLGLVAEKTKEAKGFAEEFGLAFSSAFEDAVIAGGELSDVLKGLGDDVLRIVIRKQVTEPLGNAVSGFDFGGFFSGLFGGARAAGGPVSGGKTYLVGERGPELFTPNVTGSITPNHALGTGGVNVTVSLVNQSGTPVEASAQRRGVAHDGSQLIEVVLTAVGDAFANRSGPAARGLEAGYGLRPAVS